MNTPVPGKPFEVPLFLRVFAARRRPALGLIERVKAAYGHMGAAIANGPDVVTFVDLLYRSVRFFQPRTVIQTGTGIGTSSVAIGLALADVGVGCLYTIDPDPPRYHGVRRPVKHAREAVRRAELGGIVHLVQGYSTVPLDAGRQRLIDGPRWRLPELLRQVRPDMLVVDGDHTFLGCYLDLAYGTAGLATDGPKLVLCHDYLSIREVRRAVSAWCTTTRPRVARVITSPGGIFFIQV